MPCTLRAPAQQFAQSSADPRRQREVDQLHLPLVVHQEVVRLDVAVDPALFVQVLQPFGCLHDDFWHQVGEVVQALPNQHLDVLARMIVHDQKGDRSIHVELVDLDHVGVVQGLADLQFVFQVVDLFPAAPHLRLQVLDGHPLAVPDRLPHLAGGTRADQPHHAIGTQKVATTYHRFAFITYVGGDIRPRGDRSEEVHNQNAYSLLEALRGGKVAPHPAVVPERRVPLDRTRSGRR